MLKNKKELSTLRVRRCEFQGRKIISQHSFKFVQPDTLFTNNERYLIWGEFKKYY